MAPHVMHGAPSHPLSLQPPIPDHFPFILPDPAAFPDPFASDSGPSSVLGFNPSVHLDHGPFRLSDIGSSASAAVAAVVIGDFDSDEWMESLIGESPTESSDLMSDAWQGGGVVTPAAKLPPLFVDAVAPCSVAISVPSPAFTSDLNRVVFSDPVKFSPPPPAPHQAVVVLRSTPVSPTKERCRCSRSRGGGERSPFVAPTAAPSPPRLRPNRRFRPGSGRQVPGQGPGVGVRPWRSDEAGRLLLRGGPL